MVLALERRTTERYRHRAPTLGPAYWWVWTATTVSAVGDGLALVVVPSLVRDDDLGKANGYLYAGQTAGEQFIGPAIGGLVFALGASVPFVADGISFFVSALLLTGALRGTMVRRNDSGTSL